jgi:spore maturation protein CgeB
MEILAEADAVVSASEKLIDEVLKPRGIKAFYIPQFTNSERFKPAENEAKVTEVLFVGSNHSRKGRLSVNYAVNAKADLSVYGKFWETFLAPEYLKGNYIDNDELYKYYSGAKVVLNDHREDMRYFGFVSNRIYDVTASGGFVLTDYLPEIEKAYGDSIATYKSEQEFKEKLEYYLSHDSERQNMAKRAREITLKYFTNDVAAKRFDEVLKNIQK